MISVQSEKKTFLRDIVPFKVNGQSHIILQQLSCGTRSKVSFVSNPAQISLKHSSQLTNKTTLATSFVFIRHVFHCVLHVCLCFHIVGKLAKINYFNTCIKISGNNFITYKKKKPNLVIFNAGKNFRSKIRS